MQLKTGQKIGRKLKGLWRYLSFWSKTAMRMTGNGTNSLPPYQIQLPSSRYYESIDELPLPVFIKCATSGDFSGLVKQGEVPGHVLNSAWLHLHSDYCNRIGGVHISSLINKSRALNALASKIDRIRCLVEAARLIRSEDLAGCLRAEGYHLDVSANDEDYEQQLKVIIARLRPDSMRLDRMINDMPKDTDKKAATERDFTNTLIECSKFEGYRIKANDLTTGEYCEHVRRLRESIDAQMKAAKRTH